MLIEIFQGGGHVDADLGMRKSDLFGLKIELGSIMSLDD
jgi:hypothetical protein